MKILPIFIPHAGCQHDCLYCNQRSTSQQLDIPSPDSVLAEIRSSLNIGRLDEIAFYGGSFTALPLAEQKAWLDLAKPFLASGEIGGIRLSTRPDAVNDEIADFLKESGVTTVELGCQSFSDTVLAAARRGHVAADAGASANLLRDRGFRLGIQLMPGLPSADPDEALSSLAAAISLKPDFLRIYPAIVLKETGLAETWRSGAYRPLSLDQAVETCADMELVCREQAISVIRYGLQANDMLDSGVVLDGPYHPAFGQMVRSRVWRRALAGLVMDGVDIISVHPSDLSDALGHGRNNVSFFRQAVGSLEIRPAADIKRNFIGLGDTQQNIYALALGHQAGTYERYATI